MSPVPRDLIRPERLGSSLAFLISSHSLAEPHRSRPSPLRTTGILPPEVGEPFPSQLPGAVTESLVSHPAPPPPPPWQYVEYTIENEHLYLLEVPPSSLSSLPPPCSLSLWQTNTVKAHPRFSWKGSYVVEIQSGVDAEEEGERSSFHLLDSAEIPNPISQNPLFSSEEVKEVH
jgi:hypothetical protein